MFAEKLDDLYQLCLLVTGDHERAEQCFVTGLEQCFKANGIFKDWARCWAKRVIIQIAIREFQPHPGVARSFSIPVATHMCDFPREGEGHFELAAVLVLEDFERFVFVMSVLEGYSDHDCGLLLGCTRRQIKEARILALVQLMESPLTASSRGTHFQEFEEVNR
ncbi:MAG TPA: hypothetical protein VMS18_14335 [Candidatus Binatia bacterium]|nr:hypothetical protein [Candidatus Binatia bacterium]